MKVEADMYAVTVRSWCSVVSACDVIKQNRTWDKFLTPARGWSVLKSGIASTNPQIKQTFTKAGLLGRRQERTRESQL